MYRIRPLASVGTDSSGATRAALISAASPLFADLGFEATRIQWLVKSILRRVLGSSEKDRPTRMCVREFVQPTEALDYLVKETVAAQHEITRSVVTAIAGRELPEDELSRHAISLVSQCIYYGLAEPMLTRLGVKIPRTEEEIDVLAAHIARFSLAGIRAA